MPKDEGASGDDLYSPLKIDKTPSRFEFANRSPTFHLFLPIIMSEATFKHPLDPLTPKEVGIFQASRASVHPSYVLCRLSL